MEHLDPDSFNMLGSALTDLYAQAKPRADLGYNAPVSTFMGRVTRPGEGLQGILSRLPAESPDAEGLGGISAILAGAPVAARAGAMGGFRKSFGAGGARIQQRMAAEGMPDLKIVTDPTIRMITPIDKQRAVIIQQNGKIAFGGIGPSGHPPDVIGQRAFFDEATGIVRPDTVADRAIANELRDISGQGGLLARRFAGQSEY